MNWLIALTNAGVMQQQAIINVGKVHWTVFWGSVIAPQLVAIALTVIAITVWRRVNQADLNPPIKPGLIVKNTLICGAIFGALFQWGMQETVAYITGVEPSYKAVIMALVSTGLMSMATFEILKWYALKKGWHGLHALLAVKHVSADGDCGDTPDGDLTKFTDTPKDYEQ